MTNEYVFICRKALRRNAKEAIGKLLDSYRRLRNFTEQVGNMGGSRGVGQGVQIRPGKSHLAIGFLRVAGTDLPQEAIGPLGPIAS